jgi:hypothetical protein
MVIIKVTNKDSEYSVVATYLDYKNSHGVPYEFLFYNQKYTYKDQDLIKDKAYNIVNRLGIDYQTAGIEYSIETSSGSLT